MSLWSKYSEVTGIAPPAGRAATSAILGLEFGRIGTLSCSRVHIPRDCFASRPVYDRVHIVGIFDDCLFGSGVLAGTPAGKGERWNNTRNTSGASADRQHVSSGRIFGKGASLRANRLLALRFGREILSSALGRAVGSDRDHIVQTFIT